MATLLRFVLIVSTVLTLTSPSQTWAEAPSKEYQVKAACLFNFVQFIEWPADSFADGDSPIIIGVLGDDPFGKALDQMIDGESIQGRKLVIRRSNSIVEMKGCHLLFISKSEKGRTAEILNETRDLSVATVGEVDEFAQRGGVLNFYLDGKKVRFEINPDSAKNKSLKLSAHLLKLGRIVGEGR